jgi:3-hydroxybutyryl-CoA dehydrogenase
MEIKKVGVVGCGIMGSGITQVCAQAGYSVVVSEVDPERLKKGIATIDAFLTKGIERGKMTETEKKTILGRIQGTTNLSDFQDCDLVIEAASEVSEIKKKIFADLDTFCYRAGCCYKETGQSTRYAFFQSCPVNEIIRNC